MDFSCRICGNRKDNIPYTVREMMFGFRDEFAYVECAACGCLQIREFPANLSKYYPGKYFSFTKQNIRPTDILLVPLRRSRTVYCLQGLGRLGRILSLVHGCHRFPAWMRQTRIGPDAGVLDVGCGSGKFLLYLFKHGFRNLKGIDPHLPTDIHYRNGVTVHRKNLAETEGPFDLVMFHHSYEHIQDPLECLSKVRGMLNPGGWLLLRVPTVSSYAWETYRTDWVQLDAPRHLYLHSIRSIEILASRTGLRLEGVIYDSSAFQFIGSEQYRRDIPLLDDASHAVNPARSMFSGKEIARYERRARELNQEKRGDQACFLLKVPAAEGPCGGNEP